MTSAEAARYARVSLRTIERAIHDGALESAKINGNGRRRFRRSWVDLWISGEMVLWVLVLVFAMTLLALAIGSDSCCDLLQRLSLHVHSHE